MMKFNPRFAEIKEEGKVIVIKEQKKVTKQELSKDALLFDFRIKNLEKNANKV